jgi:hypothetical protein
MLIQAIGTSARYRESAEHMLIHMRALDASLSQSVEIFAQERGTDYFININRLDRKAPAELSLAIRSLKDEIDDKYSQLGQIAGLVDHVSGLVGRASSLDVRGNRWLLASVPFPGRNPAYAGADDGCFESSIALYLGLSPFPIFGKNIAYAEEATSRSLGRYGLGAFAYLFLALRPELAFGGMVPGEIAHGGLPRPIAQRPLQIAGDGSLVLS